jgi:hypothetical protein
VDFNAGVVAAGEAQIESTVTGNDSAFRAEDKESILRDQTQVYLYVASYVVVFFSFYFPVLTMTVSSSRAIVRSIMLFLRLGMFMGFSKRLGKEFSMLLPGSRI